MNTHGCKCPSRFRGSLSLGGGEYSWKGCECGFYQPSVLSRKRSCPTLTNVNCFNRRTVLFQCSQKANEARKRATFNKRHNSLTISRATPKVTKLIFSSTIIMEMPQRPHARCQTRVSLDNVLTNYPNFEFRNNPCPKSSLSVVFLNFAARIC